ncbi:hypothetical protein JG688_00011149 [Phytophthora aleatoria]|uniref:Uncharacterized protein n=1 Tax=Phytophthora aleatoria TaxID=2496075 RepID=A0A8J5J4B8_9STRA|nr:hypothetical protein JG688_00011149 [Phytophthora aleatoria]
MPDKEDDEVLAFLLGSMPSLDASEHDSAVSRAENEAVDDLPALEHVSDISATAEGSSNSDWDAITSCESEDDGNAADTPHPEATEQEICTKDPELKSSMERKTNNIAEAEHEDDCAAPMSSEPDDGVHQEEKIPSKKEENKKKSEQGSRSVAKLVKGRRGSAGNRASKGLRETPGKRDGSDPTLEEFLFVGCVATVLIAYVIACVYSFFHPLVLPLPGYEELYSAYGISNVSVDIVNPAENSYITPQGVSFEWKLVNFPTEALHLYGAEVFRYQVSLDDEIITSEIGFLALQDEESGAAALNRTVNFPIPPRKFTRESDAENELFKLHLEVTIPIPGLIEELKTYNQDVYVRKPPTPSRDDGVHITLTSPLDGATFEQHQSIVLEYTAVNVQNMVVLIDDNIYLKKTHTNDGNMLLRGLGVGPHTFEVQALDKQNGVTASSTVHVKII